MEGKITVTYAVVCDDDINIAITLEEMLANEKVSSLIKREFAKGARNVLLDHSSATGTLFLSKEKAHHTVTIDKDDFADALTFAEEDAKKRKLLKGKCSRVELLDLRTESE